MRNNRTNTSICAYSPRARAGAPVSVPLGWDELSAKPDRWTLLTVPRRLQRLRAGPWAEYWTTAQRISKKTIDALRKI
jgi:bifunctional non-homologous end joining protein LigD